MPRPRLLWDALETVAPKVRRARALILAIDFDGTLTPIVDHPTRAALPARARRALRSLARQDGIEIAVISGRGLDDLRRRVGIPGIHYAGNAGLATLAPDGRRAVHVPASRLLPRAIVAEARAFCRRHPGTWVEDKGLTLALHYRRLDPARGRAFLAGVTRHWRHDERVERMRGKKVVELLPAVRWNKASVLRSLWRRHAALTLSLGDDVNDEPMHEWVRHHRGVSVTIAHPGSRAEYFLRTPEEVVEWLEWLAREWRARAAPRPATVRRRPTPWHSAGAARAPRVPR